MSKSWAISGVDLHLELEGTRVRAGLERALRDAVRSGRLGGGTRLPSSRSLAHELGLSRNTVAQAYGQLVAEGWLVARQGAGTMVARRLLEAEPAASATARVERLRYDLRAGFPDVTSFPTARWLAAARRAVRRAPYDDFGYPEPRGVPVLRHALSEYLARARGVRVTPDRLVVCAGLAQGLELLCGALRATGAKRFALEEYGHAAHLRTIVASGLDPSLLTVDVNGAVASELGNADAALLTPAHQFPLGHSLSATRRLEFVSWAENTGGCLVEDDYDGEFRYDRRPLGALQALAPEHVVYAGTASKSLAPGVGLAWLVLPAALLEPVLEQRRLTGGPSPLVQLTMAEFIASGQYDRHVRRMRQEYRRRRDRLMHEIGRRAPTARMIGVDAGLHLVLELSSGLEEDEIVARGRARNLVLEGLTSFAHAASPSRPSLVVGYGTPPAHAFSTAVARLCAALTRES